MNRAVEILNKHFLLRDCSNKQPLRFNEQMQLFDREYRPGCLRFEIETCLGPCVGACSRQRYWNQVTAATEFLRGGECDLLARLESAMHAAAERQQYELAWRLRDDARILEYVQRRIVSLAETRRRCNFVYAASGGGERAVWYLIAAGEVVDAVAAPSCRNSFANCRSQLRRWCKQVDEGPCAEAQHPQTLSLVSMWFRKNPIEFERTFHPTEAGRKYRGLRERYTKTG